MADNTDADSIMAEEPAVVVPKEAAPYKAEREALVRLREANIDQTTPVEALALLARLREGLGDDS